MYSTTILFRDWLVVELHGGIATIRTRCPAYKPEPSRYEAVRSLIDPKHGGLFLWPYSKQNGLIRSGFMQHQMVEYRSLIYRLIDYISGYSPVGYFVLMRHNLRMLATSLPRIRYENQENSPVRVQIQDRQRSALFEELRQARYAGEFDLSSLPAGLYTIHLQTHQAHYQQTVRVELLGGRYPIVTTNLPKQPGYSLTQNERVVNQLNQ